MVRANGPLSAARDAYVPSFATRQDISIPAAGGIVKVGPFSLYFSERSVCDPMTAGYGPSTWNNACETLNSDYRLTAAYWEEDGQVFVEFLDDIRFSPDRWVMISAKPPVGATEILYFRRGAAGSVVTTDEAQVDASMQSYYSEWTNEVYRRIKHFSGYVVASGRCEEDPSAPECQNP